MKKFLVLNLAVLAVSACAPQPTEPAADLLQKSALANQTIESASFSLQSSFEMISSFLGGKSKGDVRANGLLQNGGKQLMFSFDANGTTSSSKSPWRIGADVTIPSEQEVYIRLREADADATISPGIAALQQLQDRWFALPKQSNNPITPVTPDPSMLRMQAEVIDVVADKGFASIGGRRAHHYVVRVNKDKLVHFLKEISVQRGEPFNEEEITASISTLTMDGDVWIDAQTYIMRRVSWTISSSSVAQPMKMTIHADIIDAPGAQRIVPPADVQTLPSNNALPLPAEPSFTP